MSNIETKKDKKGMQESRSLRVMMLFRMIPVRNWLHG